MRRVSKDEARSVSWFETAQGRLLTMRLYDTVNQGPALTKGPLRTSFTSIPWSFEPAGLQPR
jgi:hypothetical protein